NFAGNPVEEDNIALDKFTHLDHLDGGNAGEWSTGFPNLSRLMAAYPRSGRVRAIIFVAVPLGRTPSNHLIRRQLTNIVDWTPRWIYRLVNAICGRRAPPNTSTWLT